MEFLLFPANLPREQESPGELRVVGGGVMVDTQAVLANRTGTSDDRLTTPRIAVPLANIDDDSITWWWDAKP